MRWKISVLCVGVSILIIGCDSYKPMDFPDPMETSPGLVTGPKGKFEFGGDSQSQDRLAAN